MIMTKEKENHKFLQPYTYTPHIVPLAQVQKDSVF